MKVMTECTDALARYQRTGSEEAFRDLVDGYVDLVYSTALRRLSGDKHWAEDITQLVFSDLARKGRLLPRNVVLAGQIGELTAAQALPPQLVWTNSSGGEEPGG